MSSRTCRLVAAFVLFSTTLAATASRSRAESPIIREESSSSDKRVRVALRLGGAGPASSGFLSGVDVTIPTLRVSDRWAGRVDYDVWNELNLQIFSFDNQSRSNQSYSITLSQLTVGALNDRGPYAGIGVGFSHIEVSGRETDGPALKLTAGVNAARFLAIEGFLLTTGRDTALGGVVRLRF